MTKIKAFSSEKLIKKIEKSDYKYSFKQTNTIPNCNELENALEREIDLKNFTKKTVLGIDIYKYSQFEPLEQTLVPVLFKLIYNEAARLCLSQSKYLFQNYKKSEDFNDEFISTGDGGFQIFPTPLHAVAFAIRFEMIVRCYNSYHFYPKLRKLIGSISLRYAMTYDKVFRLDDNFFGPSIINNDRILSKDSLNRFLLDQNTFDWFMFNMNGIENLQFISTSEIGNFSSFKNYNQKLKDEIFPDKMDFTFQKIISTNIQKIGDITAKSTSLSIYNFHLQYLGGLKEKEIINEKFTMSTISLGNLNTSGIE